MCIRDSPDTFPPWQRRYLHAATAASCRHARRLITISESGKQDVHRVYGVPLERIDVVVPGVGDAYRPVSYTHLRAHETVLDLVCRLLLEKKKTKKKHVSDKARQNKNKHIIRRHHTHNN